MSAVLTSSPLNLAPPRRLLSPGAWGGVLAALLVVCLLVPVLNLAVPAGHPLHLSDFFVSLTAKIMCYAICALAMDLVWGYTGILSLGHGLFFALGGYGMGMYLMRQIGRDGQHQSDLPDFMVFLDWKALPWQWWGSEHFLWAMFLVVAVPGLLAFVFGYFAFRSRVKGVYFSIITQALTFAAMLLFFRNNTGFGGNNGFTDFKRILGFAIATPDAMRVVGGLGQVLGPRGLMPNPKVGTVTPDVAGAVKNAKAGQVQFRANKEGIVHCSIGRASFEVDRLQGNLSALIDALNKSKPASVKGIYLRKVSLSSTMGVGVRVDTAALGGQPSA